MTNYSMCSAAGHCVLWLGSPCVRMCVSSSCGVSVWLLREKSKEQNVDLRTLLYTFVSVCVHTVHVLNVSIWPEDTWTNAGDLVSLVFL